MIASLIGLVAVVLFDHVAAANPNWSFNSTGGFFVKHLRDYLLSSSLEQLGTTVEKAQASEKKII